MSSDGLPSGWVSAKISEIADHCLGKMLDRGKNSKGILFPYLRNINVRWGSFELDDVLEMRFHEDELDRYSLQIGDLLICEGGEPGRCAIWSGEISGIKFQKALHRVRPYAGIDPSILAFQLKVAAENGRLANFFTGTTIKHLTGRSLAELPIVIPPINEQRRIVAKIEALQERSQRVKKALEAVPPLLEKFRQSVLAAAFRGDLTADWRAQNPDVEPASELLERIRLERRRRWEEAELAKMEAKGKVPKNDKWKAKYKEPVPPDTADLPELPSGWVWTTVEMVGNVLLGRRRAPEYAGMSRPYLRVANVRDDVINFSDIKAMPFDDRESLLYELRAGDILVSEGQSLHRTGQSAIFRGEIEGLCFQSTLHRFRPDRGVVTSEFAQLVFRSHMYSGVFRKFSSITTNIAHLPLGKFKCVPFPLAPPVEQLQLEKEATRLLSDALKTLGSVASQRLQLKRLDSAILRKAFQGKLVPQDPNDEPAEVLLERIRRERQATPPKKPARRRRKKAAPS